MLSVNCGPEGHYYTWTFSHSLPVTSISLQKLCPTLRTFRVRLPLISNPHLFSSVHELNTRGGRALQEPNLAAFWFVDTCMYSFSSIIYIHACTDLLWGGMNLTSDWGIENSGLAIVWLGLSLSIAILVRIVETLSVVCLPYGWGPIMTQRAPSSFGNYRHNRQSSRTSIHFKMCIHDVRQRWNVCKETITTEDGTSWKWVDILGGPVMILFNLNALDASLWKSLQRLVPK